MGYRKTLLVNMCVAMGGGIATAQTAQTGQPATAVPQREPRRLNVPPSAANNGMAEQASELMKRTGGSLVQAQLIAQASPAQAKPGAISFIAVPEATPRTLKQHDLVTIVVNEQSEITTKGTSNADARCAA